MSKKKRKKTRFVKKSVSEKKRISLEKKKSKEIEIQFHDGKDILNTLNKAKTIKKNIEKSSKQFRKSISGVFKTLEIFDVAEERIKAFQKNMMAQLDKTVKILDKKQLPDSMEKDIKKVKSVLVKYNKMCKGDGGVKKKKRKQNKRNSKRS